MPKSYYEKFGKMGKEKAARIHKQLRAAKKTPEQLRKEERKRVDAFMQKRNEQLRARKQVTETKPKPPKPSGLYGTAKSKREELLRALGRKK